MTEIFNNIKDFLLDSGLGLVWADRWASAFLVVTDLLVACIVYLLLVYIVNPLIRKITSRTNTKADDILFRDNFLKWVWWCVSVAILQNLIPGSLKIFPVVAQWIDVILKVIEIGFITKAIVEFVKGVFLVVFDRDKIEEEAVKMRLAEDNDEEYQYIPSHSLKGLQQMICLVIAIIGGILMASVLFGKNPLIIVSGLGAGAAVLMLVFKDSILGVVAGIQLTANDMLRPGDWIVASRFGANGRVQEVTLATVKVLNWDHTIVTIPPYNLISDSFQNWRRMESTGGRRIMRSFNIDMTTVRFLSENERERWKGESWAEKIRWEEPVVNLTLFRAYLEHYILTRPTLKKKMLYMVRELQPTGEGLPIEIYFFTSKTSWAAYESIQAEVLDHILAVVDNFGLRLFQRPTGYDVMQNAKMQN